MFRYALADDLTGAAELGMALFQAHGVATLLVNAERCSAVPPPCLSVNTHTRACTTPLGAYQNSLATLKHLNTQHTPYIKMDSTWRGYPVASALATLAFTDTHLAIICPAYPEAGRTTENGIALLHGKPVHETVGVLNDPQHPVLESCIATRLQNELRKLSLKADVWVNIDLAEALQRISTLSLSDFMKSRHTLPILWVPNIANSSDLNQLVLSLHNNVALPGQPVWVGSMGLAIELLKCQLGSASQNPTNTMKPMEWGVISGSLNPTTGQQLEALQTRYPSQIPILNTAAWPKTYDWPNRLQQASLEFTHQYPNHTVILCGGDTALQVLNAHGVKRLVCVQSLNQHCALWQDDVKRHWVLKSGNMGKRSLLVDLCQAP